MRTAVITPVAGRHDHLGMQRRGLERGRRRPGEHVVVAMGDAELEAALAGPLPTTVRHLATRGGKLPLAQARNAGATVALDHGADVLIFLDVDCIPAERLIERYTECAASSDGDGLLCGAVAYLPPPPAGGYRVDALPYGASAHPARPVAADDEVIRAGNHELFWSLSFAVTRATWVRIGGFDESYVGYGGEDTDFGQRAAAAGVPLHWVGGAWAYHQFHPTSEPPTQHLEDILRNATIFRHRWGWWPMIGWLRALRELGLVTYDEAHDRWSAA